MIRTRGDGLRPRRPRWPDLRHRALLVARFYRYPRTFPRRLDVDADELEGARYVPGPPRR